VELLLSRLQIRVTSKKIKNQLPPRNLSHCGSSAWACVTLQTWNFGTALGNPVISCAWNCDCWFIPFIQRLKLRAVYGDRRPLLNHLFFTSGGRLIYRYVTTIGWVGCPHKRPLPLGPTKLLSAAPHVLSSQGGRGHPKDIPEVGVPARRCRLARWTFRAFGFGYLCPNGQTWANRSRIFTLEGIWGKAVLKGWLKSNCQLTDAHILLEPLSQTLQVKLLEWSSCTSGWSSNLLTERFKWPCWTRSEYWCADALRLFNCTANWAYICACREYPSNE